MKFEINNCNNIDNGEVNLKASKLNIRFGINGTGKSTITKAIKYSIDSPEKLVELTPFKLRGVETELKPSVVKPNDINSVLIFNEDYLNQFLYKEDELIANSFEIFIKTPSFVDSTTKIKELLKEITDVFSDNDELDQVISDFENLSKNFKSTQSGLSKTSSVYKGLEDGNKLEHIPKELSAYKPFLKNENCTTWLDWQIKGEKFIDISDSCPYCTSSTEGIKDTIKSVSKTYDKNVIKNFVGIIDALENLGKYFATNTKENIDTITKKQSGLSEEELNFLFEIKQQIDVFHNKLKTLKNITPNTFQGDGVNVEEMIKALKINIDLFNHFKSEKSEEIVLSINSSLDVVLKQIGELQGEINKQRLQTQKLISEHQLNINTFLKNAGYRYTVEIENTESIDYKLKLKHVESTEKISKGNQHLSFGERNAFALVLFMYETLSKNPDLIILDDPISSFDKNKKYAIMHMLFRGGKCLKNKNVIMFTHDFDPVIDTVKVLPQFNNLSESKFLSTKNGLLEEKEINKNDILTFSQICDKVIGNDELDILVKLIYLRRKYEIIDDSVDEYQVISNLFHKRKIEDIKDFRKFQENKIMDIANFNAGINNIIELLPNFDYETLLGRILDEEDLKSLYNSNQNGYIKLQLFRLIYSDSLRDVNSVLRKFINETYHVENELISQLDPTEFEIIPDSIIAECDNYLVNN